MSALTALARWYPWSVDPEEDLRRAVRFLGISASPSVVVRASYGLGVIGALVTMLVGLLTPAGTRPVVVFVLASVTVLTVLGGCSLPTLLATARRVRALGDAPDLVARAVLRMRLSPSPERAARCAASAGEGPLA
jgi:hypothetical protein